MIFTKEKMHQTIFCRVKSHSNHAKNKISLCRGLRAVPGSPIRRGERLVQGPLGLCHKKYNFSYRIIILSLRIADI
jgi:hypothetical protein